MYFINALERIPDMIEKREKENAELSKRYSGLAGNSGGLMAQREKSKSWVKELATLNRKIQLTLKPVGRHENVEGKETGTEEQRLVSGSA